MRLPPGEFFLIVVLLLIFILLTSCQTYIRGPYIENDLTDSSCYLKFGGDNGYCANGAR